MAQMPDEKGRMEDREIDLNYCSATRMVKPVASGGITDSS